MNERGPLDKPLSVVYNGNVPIIVLDANMKRSPTILDVAKAAGVSKSTVSRVIADNGQGVSETTKQRVLKAIQELGYAPNAIARSMRTTRTNTVMLAIPDITNPYWPEVARGVQDVMDEEGYAVVFANSDWDEQRERAYLDMARRNRFDGILINPVQISSQELQGYDIPTVVLGTRGAYGTFDRVGADSYSGIYMATEHLISLGHRRIGLVLGHRQSNARDTRLAGYQDALAAAGIPVQEDLILKVPFMRQGGKQAFQSFMQLSEPPTAMVCANDIIALGALQAAHEAGIKVPDEISITGLDDIDAAASTTPSLTTVSKPKYDIGRQAAIFLLERIRGEGPEAPRRLVFAGRLRVRGTTAPPSGS